MNNDLNITPEQASLLDEAFVHFFPKLENPTLVYSADTPWSTPKKEYSWSNRKEFIAHIERLTGIKIDETKLETVKAANKKIHELTTTIVTSEEVKPPEQPAATTPDQIRLKELQEELVAKETRTVETEKSDQVVKDAIARKKEIYEQEQAELRKQIKNTEAVQAELDGKKIYAKVEVPEKPVLNDKEQQDLQLLKDLAKKNPDKLVNDFSKNIEEKITPTLNELSPEEIELIAKNSAVDIVEKLNPTSSYVPLATQTGILKTISSTDEAVLVKTGISKEASQTLKNGSVAILLSEEGLNQRAILESLLGHKITTEIYGTDPVQVTLSNQPQQGYMEVDLGQLNQQSHQIQSNQLSFLDTIQDTGLESARSELTSRAGVFLENRIATLPADSTIARIYAVPEVQAVLSTYGLAQPVVWEGVGVAGKIVTVFPQAGPLLSVAGRITGVPLVTPVITTGVVAAETAGAVAGEAAATAAGTVATEAAATAAGTAVGAEGAAVGAAAGTPFGGPVGAAVGALIGFIGGKLLKPLFSKLAQLWTKNKDKMAPIGIGLLGLGLLTRSVPLMIISTPFLGAGLIGGTAGLAAAGAGFIGGIRFIFKNLIGPSIIAPIAITMLVLPVLVAFIMFVINSGAYIVPPTPVSDVPFGPGFGFECTDEKTPVSFSNNTSSPIAKRAWEITADLYQGFWCFWNRSPGDLPTDTTDYPPSYPELFNEGLFARNPNPTRGEASTCGECLFWCTWLVQKAYKENGVSIQYTLWSPTMQEDFNRRGKFIESDSVTPSNLTPGSVIFFDVVNSLNRTDHVGIAHTINSDGVYFVQSNAGTKDGFIPFNSSGNGLQNIPGIRVVGIGIP